MELKLRKLEGWGWVVVDMVLRMNLVVLKKGGVEKKEGLNLKIRLNYFKVRLGIRIKVGLARAA